jgi:uncharacterized membrane protein
MKSWEEEIVSIGMILLTAVAVLIFFGVAQRVLDRMRLSDRAALVIVAAMFFGTLIPDIRIGMVQFNIGGAVIPVAVCLYLIFKAETAKEKWRAVIGSLLTGGLVYVLGLVMPNEPEQIVVDPNYVYGVVGGLVAYLFGRSRRNAFICGVLGVLLADIAVAVVNWSRGISQTLVLGGAGAVDAMVISGVLGVLLAELIGEVAERMVRGKNPDKDNHVHKPREKGEEKQ